MKKFKTLLATALLTTATSTLVYANSPEQQFEQGGTAYNTQDYQTAFELWKHLADQGSAEAQYNLGLMYYKGEGVKQDYQQAMKWYQKAAELGYANAQYYLGVLYYNGQGVKQDYHQAFKWHQKAAERGDVKAQFVLGSMYEDGKGVRQDKTKAKDYFGLACDNGLQLGCDNYRRLNSGGW